jgi:hypothetical protein
MESFNVQQSGSTNSERLKAMRDIADSASEDEEEEATTEEILEAEEVDDSEMEEMALISVIASPMGIKASWARDKYHHRMGMLLNPGRKGEYNLVGAGVGGGFVNTKELHVMKYKQAMATQDQASWTKAVQEEHERMVHHGVFKVAYTFASWNQSADLYMGYEEKVQQNIQGKTKCQRVWASRWTALAMMKIPRQHQWPTQQPSL